MPSGLPDVRLIGRRIKLRRNQLGLEQQEVANRANLSIAYISRIENGVITNPKSAHLAQIADALEMTLEHLIRRNPASDQNPAATDLAKVISMHPRLSLAFANIAGSMDDLGPEDQSFVVSAIELIASRYALDKDAG